MQQWFRGKVQVVLGAMQQVFWAFCSRSAKRSPQDVQIRTDEETRRVHSAIAKLRTDLDRDVVRLRFFEGLSLRQISERLDVPRETVRDHYKTAMSLLERELVAMPPHSSSTDASKNCAPSAPGTNHAVRTDTRGIVR